MKKTEMLKKNYEFKTVLSKGKFYVQNEIEIVIQKNNKNKNFLGIAVSTKNGKSFQRNRAKRLIRESYKKLETQLEEGNNIIILINKKYDINQIDFNSVITSMRDCFKKANLLKKEDE